MNLFLTICLAAALSSFGSQDYQEEQLLPDLEGYKSVSCSFRFVPGEQFFVNQINILGTKSSEEEVEIRSDIFLKEKYPFSLNALYHSIRSVKAKLEGKEISIKDFRYERLTDNPGKVNIFIQIESEKH
jgi:outer membrane protein assembly factor BamA